MLWIFEKAPNLFINEYDILSVVNCARFDATQTFISMTIDDQLIRFLQINQLHPKAYGSKYWQIRNT